MEFRQTVAAACSADPLDAAIKLWASAEIHRRPVRVRMRPESSTGVGVSFFRPDYILGSHLNVGRSSPLGASCSLL